MSSHNSSVHRGQRAIKVTECATSRHPQGYTAKMARMLKRGFPPLWEPVQALTAEG